MIDKELIAQTVRAHLVNTDCFLVSVSVSAANEIVVEIDSETGIDVDFCAELSRHIEAQLDRDADDFSLEVGSAGITAPFKVQAQYAKNLGNEVELLTKDGRKLSGILSRVDDAGFAVETTKMVKPEGAKRKVAQTETLDFGYDDTKYIRAVLKF